MQNKKAARARYCEEKMSFEKREFFERNLMWNGDGKENGINEAVLKVILNVKSAK